MVAKLIPVLLLAGCTVKPPAEIDWHTFDGNRAFAQAEKLVSFGPRPSGTDAMARQAGYITSQLREFGLDAEEQTFLAVTPRGQVQFRNVVAKTLGGSGPVILVGAHSDTKWFTNMTFVGANDGASGAAVLLEMARVVAARPNIWFVFFDGEECSREYSSTDGLHGSRHFVEDLQKSGKADSVKAMVLLDMIGDARLNITLPVNGDPKLIEQAFEAARDTGHRDFFALGKGEVLDDHVPFLRAGIPAVDLIDFEFGSAPGRNDYWHTDKDTLDKITPQSLAIAGQTALRLISRLQQLPGRGLAVVSSDR
jgi:glutaminyl-peptide cyclotransferase